MSTKLSTTEIKILAKMQSRESGMAYGQTMMGHKTIPFTSAIIKLIDKGMARSEYDGVLHHYAFITDTGRDFLATLTLVESEDIPAEAPDTETMADELPASQEGHECSNCGTRWQSPDYISCPRCGYAPTELHIPTAPSLSPAERAALDHYQADWCYLGNMPVADCTCEMHSAPAPIDPRDAEIAALKARVEELKGFIGRIGTCRTLSAVDGLIERFDHAEIAARAEDYKDARDAGQGMFF